MPRNLVIVRAGDTSLHPGWLGNAGEQNWDIIVNYYGDDPDLFRDPRVRRIDSKGPKWPALYELIRKMQAEIETYDYVWFPDDDLVSNVEDMNKFFAIFHEHALKLAQPALTPDSIIGCPITLRNRAFKLRFTAFVEVMAPCFSREFLKQCWPLFTTNISGYGLDYLLPNRAGDASKVAIIDAVSVRHTRSQGELYDVFRKLGCDPIKELNDLVYKEKIHAVPMILGGIDTSGQLHAVWNNGHQQLIKHLLAGWLPEFANSADELYKLLDPILMFLAAAKPPAPPAAS